MRVRSMTAFVAVAMVIGSGVTACGNGGRGEPTARTFTHQLTEAGYTEIEVTEQDAVSETEDGRTYTNLRATAKAGTCDVVAQQTAFEGDDSYGVLPPWDSDETYRKSLKYRKRNVTAEEFISEVAKDGLSCSAGKWIHAPDSRLIDAAGARRGSR